MSRHSFESDLDFAAEAQRVVSHLRDHAFNVADVNRAWRQLSKILDKLGHKAPSYLGSVNSSSKIIKGEKFNVDTFVMYMAPAKFAGIGNVCPSATKGCEASCLNLAGRANFDKSIVRARVLRTWIWYGAREVFNARIHQEVHQAKLRAAKKQRQFAVRLNGTSDLSPTMFTYLGSNILDRFPDVQFYDYTKVVKRFALLNDYSNYQLTYSWHDGADFDEVMELAHHYDSGVAIPFYVWDSAKNRLKHARSVKLPSEFRGVPLFDGDESDLRYLDRELGAPSRGAYIVGLRAKRTDRSREQVAIDSGFFQPINQ